MFLSNSTLPDEVGGDGRFVRPRREFVPAWVKSVREGKMKDKVEAALAALIDCTVCPRNCHIDRLANNIGVCKSGRLARVSSHFPHFGEEDVLRGWMGSGTIFMAWCNLRCVFCQNYETSQLGEGGEVTPHQLAGMMLDLQDRGCHNINFVTPEHVVPQILEALPYAYDMGVRLPIVYNTSSYDSPHSIELMDGVVDIYMPDFKLWNSERARKYLLAPDYPDAARRITKLMHQQVGELVVDEHGLALRGVIVRHLVMPGMLDDTREIMMFLARELSRDTFVNIMDQYYPAYRAKSEEKYADINRRIYPAELDGAYEHATAAGLWRFDSRWRQR
jgi:putative pyruvate formate lyase activating enzyme